MEIQFPGLGFAVLSFENGAYMRLHWILIAVFLCSLGVTGQLSPTVKKYAGVTAPKIVLQHVRVIDGTGAAAVEDRNVVIDLRCDSFELGDLIRISRLINQIARNDNKRRFKPVNSGDGKFEIGRFLGEILVVSEHAELRIAELDKEERFCRGRRTNVESKENSNRKPPCCRGKKCFDWRSHRLNF